MTYYERFSGNYKEASGTIYKRIDDLATAAIALEPENLDEVLAALDTNPDYYYLEWIDVPNPLRPADGDTIKVRPKLGLQHGYNRGEDLRYDKGLNYLGIDALTPDGKEWHLGHMNLQIRNGKPIHDVELLINDTADPTPWHEHEYTSYDSADVPLFLSVVEAALAAQPRKD